jgi:hypothetical protein
MKWQMPKTLQWVIKLFLIFLLVFTLFRISTYIAFKPADVELRQVLSSFLLGIRFDIRWISILLMPIVLLSFIPKFSPYSSIIARRVWVVYLATATFLLMFFFGADYGHFAYVSTRLNASALNFAEDAKISFEMLWQSYPLFWMILALLVLAYFFYQLYKKTHQHVEFKNSQSDIIYKRRWYFFVLFSMVLGIYGSFSFKPLKWKDAFVFKDNFKSYLALNPLQNFFTTLRFRTPDVDNQSIKTAYKEVANFLQLEPQVQANHSFERTLYPSSRALESKPNIVLVICESFSMYKSSMSGNVLNSTPYFNQLTKEGIFLIDVLHHILLQLVVCLLHLLAFQMCNCRSLVVETKRALISIQLSIVLMNTINFILLAVVANLTITGFVEQYKRCEAI